ncbi:class I SAM-dependent RNA methyltransferase [Porticoccus hydrocarbonoclasticus]|uniref:class I SAM-dependent RNA methyltransferase n=1 Tax=Porticoccus hydrocarbonoclasticus TaxID=1073414 RepID=UPI00056693F3|nr:TRAM domain-containing protein [Porticoccus hydrocarbonoclasticus]
MKPRRPHPKAKRQSPNRPIEFLIESIDPMGQGVAKIDSKPCFIAKTLPGEQGSATITRASKGVLFARMSNLSSTAENRITPACEHFEQCSGCHFLHTDYESELTYKRNALADHLKRLSVETPDIRVAPAEQRLGYRNRMQLHYRHKYLGMIDPVTDAVLEIPHCQVIDERLRETFDSLYQDKSWTEDHQGQGHCELYLTDDGVSVQWDQPYAHGGFTQVNRAMNEMLRETVRAQLDDLEVGTLLDLFSGEGNLSDLILPEHPGIERVMVDYAPERAKLKEELSFIHLDLFSDTALRAFKARTEHTRFDVLLVDPPRKGFVHLAQWVKAYRPKKLIYVSCSAPTMVRDLQLLGGDYRIEQVNLIDLFPGTYHYETQVTITFK